MAPTLVWRSRKERRQEKLTRRVSEVVKAERKLPKAKPDEGKGQTGLLKKGAEMYEDMEVKKKKKNYYGPNQDAGVGQCPCGQSGEQ